VIDAIILRHFVPPPGHEGNAFGGHESGKLPRIDKPIANVIVSAATEAFFQKTERRLKNKGRLKARFQVRMFQRHVPFVDDGFGLWQGGKSRERGFDVSDTFAEIGRIIVVDMPGEKIERRAAIATVLDETGADLTIIPGKRRPANFGGRSGPANRPG